MFEWLKNLGNETQQKEESIVDGTPALHDLSEALYNLTLDKPIMILKKVDKYLVASYNSLGQLSFTIYSNVVEHDTLNVLESYNIYTQGNRIEPGLHNFQSTQQRNDQKKGVILENVLGCDLVGYREVETLVERIFVIRHTILRSDEKAYLSYLDEESHLIYNAIERSNGYNIETIDINVALLIKETSEFETHNSYQLKVRIVDIAKDTKQDLGSSWTNPKIKFRHVLMTKIWDIVLNDCTNVPKLLDQSKNVNRVKYVPEHKPYNDSYEIYERDVHIIMQHYDKIKSEFKARGKESRLPPIRNKSDLCAFANKFVRNEYYTYLNMNGDWWIIDHIIEQYNEKD